jgi:hypothetical protein
MRSKVCCGPLTFALSLLINQALVESRVVLSTLCHRFDFRILSEKEKIHEVRRVALYHLLGYKSLNIWFVICFQIKYGVRDSFTIPLGPADGMPMKVV